MIKTGFSLIFTLAVLTSLSVAIAQEETAILIGTDVKEWHAIAVALISENRHEEAVKYYDRILEKNPNDVKALANKGISLAFLRDWAEAEKSIFRAVELEPDNKDVESIKFQFFEGVPSKLAHDSVYDINLRVTVRDSSGNLVSVSDASNTRYLPYSITDEIFDKYIVEEKIMLSGKMYDIAQRTDVMIAPDDASGAFGWSVTKYGHEFDIFLGFIPMVLTEPDDEITTEWRILKEII